MRYEARAALAMGGVITVALVGFVGLRGAMAPPARAFPVAASADSFAVRDPEYIRPDSATYARFAAADAAWRRKYASASALRDESGQIEESSEGRIWRPSPRQALDDAVFELYKAGRFDDAIAELTNWVQRHPGDRDELLKLARLLNQAGHGDESIARYRQLLALESSGRR
jgi:tetratricopeptide (TPR) repeat protein